MKLSAAVSVLLLGATFCCAKDKPCPSPEIVKDAKFRPGQVWLYKSRAGEEKSFLTVLRIESLPNVGTIVHVRVDNIRLRNCTGGSQPDTFQHMPFTRDAIDRSVTKMVKEDSDIPDYKEGYDEWRNACGGVYTITVSEAVTLGEATFRKGMGCESK